MSYIDITINGKRITSREGKIFINGNEVIENQFTDKPWSMLSAMVLMSFTFGMFLGVFLATL